MKPAERVTNNRYWLAFGAIFSILAYGLIMAAFFAGDGSACDRWTLLKYILPVFAGISAGAFAGALTANGTAYGLTIAATGGFAVWCVTLFAYDVPPRCREPIVSHFMHFENTATEGELGHRLPKSLETKSGAYDIPERPENFVMFLAFVVSNIYIGAEQNIDLEIRVSGLDKEGKEVWYEKDYFDWLGAWHNMDLAKRYKQDLPKMLGVNEPSGDGKFIVAWTIECMKKEELANWDGTLRIQVKDHKRPPVEFTRFVSLGSKPEEFNVSSVRSTSCS